MPVVIGLRMEHGTLLLPSYFIRGAVTYSGTQCGVCCQYMARDREMEKVALGDGSEIYACNSHFLDDNSCGMRYPLNVTFNEARRLFATRIAYFNSIHFPRV